MAECIVLKGGSGADLDAITAGAGDVLAPKVIVGPDGEPLTGIMPNRGAISQALGINGTYTIPEGYHNGSGKVTQSVATLAGQTINPTASQQTVSSSGKYMTGNVVVNGVSNLTAANVKKGVNVGGTVGTFEGYVPTATDLYLRGNNPGNVNTKGTAIATLDSGQITIKTSSPLANCLVFTRNLTGFTLLNIQGLITNLNQYSRWQLYKTSGDGLATSSYITATSYTISIPISAYQITDTFDLVGSYVQGAVYRIWLS